MRLEVSTLPAATAAGNAALTRQPGGAVIVTGANAPEEAGMSGAGTLRITKYPADRVTASGQLQLPGPAVSVPVKSTLTRSPDTVTATRMAIGSSETPSPSSHSSAR